MTARWGSAIGDIPNIPKTKVLALGLSQKVANDRALPEINLELASIVQTTRIYSGQNLLDRCFTFRNLVTNLRNKILHIATHGKFWAVIYSLIASREPKD